jgi:hypothetical protein
MTSNRRMTAAVLCGLVASVSMAHAEDHWDLIVAGDNACASTTAELVHGGGQTHDLEGTAPTFDVDWARIQQRAYRSYEVRLHSSTLKFAQTASLQLSGCPTGVLQAAVPYEGAAYDAASLRWLSTGDVDVFTRTTAGSTQTARSRYEIQLLETTYAVPRFNNSATQQTILLLQNTRAEAVAGQVHFFAAGGTLLHSQPFAVGARGVLVLNTAGIVALAGQSGSLQVAHDGGYGALAGKAVSLEPATGFAFDTLLAPIPY